MDKINMTVEELLNGLKEKQEQLRGVEYEYLFIKREDIIDLVDEKWLNSTSKSRFCEHAFKGQCGFIFSLNNGAVFIPICYSTTNSSPDRRGYVTFLKSIKKLDEKDVLTLQTQIESIEMKKKELNQEISILQEIISAIA